MKHFQRCRDAGHPGLSGSVAAVPARVFLALSLILAPVGRVTAQGDNPQPAPAGPRQGTPPFLKKTGDILRALFAYPVHLVVKGVASGGGPGTGLGVDVTAGAKWKAAGFGVITARKYWSAQADAGYHGDRAELVVYGRIRDMKQLDFYGPGPESLTEDRTNFRLKDQVVGARAAAKLAPWLSVGARGETLLPEVGPGHNTTLPSIDQRFSESDAPGLSSQPRFMRYEGSVDVQVPAGAGEAFFQGGNYRATYAVFTDQDDGHYDFRRLDLEARNRFAVFGPHRRLTLHGWLSTTATDPGDEVPFYLQRTLGGRSNVRTVDEALIGLDGTQASLRGFRPYRFRDRHLLLLQAEYRIPIWGPFDVTLFADAGKVASRWADIDLSNLRHDYGFSLSVMQGRVSALRLDLALGGGEGVRLLFSVGSDALP